jgi:hypothetical protein
MDRCALFVFNPDLMCFVHVLLNALDMQQRGVVPAIVMEGAATRLVLDLDPQGHPLHSLWQRVKTEGLVAGVCRACAGKTGSIAAAQEQGLPLLEELSGHPSMAAFRQQGYTLLIF